MLIDEIRKYIIKPVLTITGLGSESAEVLLAGTIMVETNCEYLMQINSPKNGGYGLYQIEEIAHKDIKIYLTNRMNKNMLDRVLSASFMEILPNDNDPLIYNIRYATLIARLIYYRDKHSLPLANDAKGMSEYHKIVFNTKKGKADQTHNAAIFQKVIDQNEQKV